MIISVSQLLNIYFNLPKPEREQEIRYVALKRPIKIWNEEEREKIIYENLSLTLRAVYNEGELNWETNETIKVIFDK